MNIHGDIILIEDDADDREILNEVFSEVLEENNYSNKLIFIEDSTQAVRYLKATGIAPFLIISDINMPKMDGFELRAQIFNDTELKDRCVPYLFLTTSGDNSEYIKKAYNMSIHGYFSKPTRYMDYKTLITGILGYWKVSKKP